ncbi:MAG: DUF3299 domain-containing protein [Rubrivivax sp.]
MIRPLLALALLSLPALSTLSGALAQSRSPAPAQRPLLGAPTPAAPVQTIAWEALVAPGWDGMKEFRNMDLSALQDSDPRAAEILKRMRRAWDDAPVNLALIGKPVRIAGYVVPLEETAEGLKEFLLVPHYGACIHTPPPPANQVVHVRPRAAVKGLRAMDTVWVSGTLAYAKADTAMGFSSWSLPAVEVQPYAKGLAATPLR